MKISICIPTWEQHGYGVLYLTELLETIRNQTFKDFNVVISDHSINNDIKDVVDAFSDNLDIVYTKNNSKRGNGPANTNNTLKFAVGEIVKIIFQDDLFYSNDALSIIHKTFEENKNVKWLVNGCNHTNDGKNFFRPMVPSWNNEIWKGVNTISSPSVLAFINDKTTLFDENLTMLMDCEYYFQLFKKYGLPKIVDDILISNRMHPHQISSMYNRNINEEINYVKIKHNIQ